MQREATSKELSGLEKRVRMMTVGKMEQFHWDDPKLGNIYVAIGRSPHKDTAGERYWAGMYGTYIGENFVMRLINWDWPHLTAEDVAKNALREALLTCGQFHEGHAYDEGWWRAGRA